MVLELTPAASAASSVVIICTGESQLAHQLEEAGLLLIRPKTTTLSVSIVTSVLLFMIRLPLSG
jgi:hypothetical protein